MTSVAVVGGGFAGVGAVAMLARAGYRDVVVFEKAERLGGVWHHNTYPGAACDIPSHLYEFSFALNPRWSRRYAPQEEIQAYIEAVAKPFDVRLGTEVTAARFARRPLDAPDERGRAHRGRADHRVRAAQRARGPAAARASRTSPVPRSTPRAGTTTPTSPASAWR